MDTPLGSKGTSFRDIYDKAVEKLPTLQNFWENDPYEKINWEIGLKLITEYFVEPGFVLDLGCGIYPHNEAARNRWMVGMDFSLESIRVASKRCSVSSINFVCGDALSLPVKTGSFHYAIAVGELWNHLDPNLFLEELAWALDGDGVVVMDISNKLCPYNIYGFLGAMLGCEYAREFNKREARQALKNMFCGSEVTWSLTPDQYEKIYLPTCGEVLRTIQKSDFEILHVFGTAVISDLVPAPVQKLEKKFDVVQGLMRRLRWMDQKFGERFPFWRWGGNLFLVLKKRRSSSHSRKP